MAGWSGLLVARIRLNPFERTGSNSDIPGCLLWPRKARPPGQRVVRATLKKLFVQVPLGNEKISAAHRAPLQAELVAHTRGRVSPRQTCVVDRRRRIKKGVHRKLILRLRCAPLRMT